MPALVSGYGSSDSEPEEEEEDNPFNNPNVNTRAQSESTSNQDSDSDSDSEEATTAKPLAPSRPAAPASVSSLLPSPLDALEQTSKPAFLTPEATKPIAELYRPPAQPKVWEDVGLTPEAARAELRANQEKAASQGAMHAAKAVMYKDQKKDEGLSTAKVDPLALAMLGVQANTSKLGSMGAAAPEADKKRPKSVLLGSGEKGEVKEREKKKRMMGQNGRDSVSWKSEEEMILRQQFDS